MPQTKKAVLVAARLSRLGGRRPALLLVASFAVLGGACRSLPDEPAPPQSPASVAGPAAPSPAPEPPAAEGRPPPSIEPDGTVHSTLAYWKCDKAGCGDDWVGAVVSWPSWSAHQGNGRSGAYGRNVFSAVGRPLYPYMGTWANGCEITALSGSIEIVEWKRGTDKWRSTIIKAPAKHVIKLAAGEDGALLEAPGFPAFSLSLKNCTPQKLP
jgi:hypothetical protein